MKTKREYHGDDIFDDNGLLKDGKALRVKLTMADGDTVRKALQRALQERDSGPMRVVDGFSRGRDSTAMHRPGYRIFDGDDAWEHQKARMYAAYDADLANRYLRDNDPVVGFGERCSTGGLGQQREGTPCTRDGWPGVLRGDKNGEFYCDISKSAGRRDAAPGDHDDDQNGDDIRLCSDCDGTGKDDAGSECKLCGGTGLVTRAGLF